MFTNNNDTFVRPFPPHLTVKALAEDLQQLLVKYLGTLTVNGLPAIWTENEAVPKAENGREAVENGVLCLIEPEYQVLRRETQFNYEILLDINWMVTLISYEEPPHPKFQAARNLILGYFELVTEGKVTFMEGDRRQVNYKINEQHFVDMQEVQP